jgi:hypothetical protein
MHYRRRLSYLPSKREHRTNQSRVIAKDKTARIRLSIPIWRHLHGDCWHCRALFGPVEGGLFLAFPAIFPASASLIESHQKQEKLELRFDGTNRGRVASSTDAAGAFAATIGLAGFGFVCWHGLLSHTIGNGFSWPPFRNLPIFAAMRADHPLAFRQCSRLCAVS